MPFNFPLFQRLGLRIICICFVIGGMLVFFVDPYFYPNNECCLKPSQMPFWITPMPAFRQPMAMCRA